MSQPIEAFKNSLKIPELKQRITFTFIVLLIISLGRHVPTPGVKGNVLAERVNEMSGVLTFGTLSKAVALDGLEQDRGRFSFCAHRSLVGGKNLQPIVTAPADRTNRLVRERLHHLGELIVAAHPMLPHRSASSTEYIW